MPFSDVRLPTKLEASVVAFLIFFEIKNIQFILYVTSFHKQIAYMKDVNMYRYGAQHSFVFPLK